MKNDLVEKQGYRRKRLLNITWDMPFFTKLTQDWKFSLCFSKVVGRSLPSRGGLQENIEFI